MKVLVATDGSKGSTQASIVVSKMAKEDPNLEIHLITVMDPSAGLVFAEPEETSVLPHLNETLASEAQTALERTEEVFADAGVKVASKSASWGDPATVICQTADEQDMDMIVVGSRGMGEISGLILGSVSDKIVHRCSKPVMIVR